jgi:hypothetical protein
MFKRECPPEFIQSESMAARQTFTSRSGERFFNDPGNGHQRNFGSMR